MSDKKPKTQSPKSKASLEEIFLQIEQLTEALQRERADVINVRRRHDEQLSSLRTLVKSSVVRDLLPVIDNFERAFRHIPATSNEDNLIDWVKGVTSIKSQFDKTLSDMGVERIKTVGEVFDPNLHEAVSVDEGEGTVEIISDELQAGYKLGDDIIRHATVKVKFQK